jgi:hypothetical protein
MKATGKFVAIALLATATIFAVSCGGNAKKKAADGTTETAQTETKAEAPKGGAATIPADKITVGSDLGDKSAVLAEIPAGILKYVGKLDNSMIVKSSKNEWKYTLVVNSSNEDPHADLAKLVADYKSAGGTVVETALSNGTKKYRVTFPGAESLDIYPFGGAIQIQWNVVKK